MTLVLIAALVLAPLAVGVAAFLAALATLFAMAVVAAWCVLMVGAALAWWGACSADWRSVAHVQR